MSSAKKRGLGRGLEDMGVDELLTRVNYAESINNASQRDEPFRQVAIAAIIPGRFQPRRQFDPEMLQGLADSIRAQGVIQPIIVRKIGDHQYELIAGERRWRAAKLAGLIEIPALIREIDDQQAVVIALIENMQRRELNAIEEAQALQQLIEKFSMTHQQIADAIGKSRAMVSNLLRLLKLNLDVRAMLEEDQLEMGHARALLALEGAQQSTLAQRIIQERLSVRETEEIIRRTQQSENISKNHLSQSQGIINADLLELQRTLSKKMGMRVQIRERADGRGRMIINYGNSEEFKSILEKIYS